MPPAELLERLPSCDWLLQGDSESVSLGAWVPQPLPGAYAVVRASLEQAGLGELPCPLGALGSPLSPLGGNGRTGRRHCVHGHSVTTSISTYDQDAAGLGTLILRLFSLTFGPSFLLLSHKYLCLGAGLSSPDPLALLQDARYSSHLRRPRGDPRNKGAGLRSWNTGEPWQPPWSHCTGSRVVILRSPLSPDSPPRGSQGPQISTQTVHQDSRPSGSESPGMEFGSVYFSKLFRLFGYQTGVENSSLDHGLQTTAPGPDPAHCLLLSIRFYWHTAMCFCFLTVCGCFYTVTEEPSGDTEATWPTKPKVFPILPFTESLLAWRTRGRAPAVQPALCGQEEEPCPFWVQGGRVLPSRVSSWCSWPRCCLDHLPSPPWRPALRACRRPFFRGVVPATAAPRSPSAVPCLWARGPSVRRAGGVGDTACVGEGLHLEAGCRGEECEDGGRGGGRGLCSWRWREGFAEEGQGSWASGVF